MTTPEDILLEMKDTSELMVDLAYSSVFYDSNKLAQAVASMEEEMGEHLLRLQRLALEKVRDGELPIDNALVALRVAQAAEVIANSALEIADVVLRDVELHPVLAESIQASDSAVSKVIVHDSSPLVGPSLRDVEFETETGMRVLAIRRGNRWNSKVRGGTRLRGGDLIIAMGPEEAIPAFLTACDPTSEQEHLEEQAETDLEEHTDEA